MPRIITLLCVLFSAILGSMAQPFPHYAPVNPNATAEARTLNMQEAPAPHSSTSSVR